MTKIVNTRIQYRHDNPDAWETTTKIPLEGELLVYAESQEVMLKVGNDISTAGNLPFVKLDEKNTKIPIPSIDSSVNIVYNGSPQSPVLIGYDETKMIMGGTFTATSAGTYAITVTPQNDYCWSDGSSVSKTINWQIKKATPNVTIVGGTTITLTEPLTDKYVNFNFNDNSLPSPIYSVTSSDPGIVIAKQSGFTKIKLTPSTTTGTATVTIVMEFGRNYETKSFMLTVTNNAAVSSVLEDNSWATISKIAAAGNAAEWWAVGDCKKIVLNGTIGTLTLSNYETYVYIIDFNHTEGSSYTNSGIQFGTFKSVSSNIDVCLVDSAYGSSSTDGTKYFSMNHSGNTNSGGWKGCDLRYDVLGSTKTKGADAVSDTATNPVANTLMAALPADLRAVMKPMTIYTDNVGEGTELPANITSTIDYLPLLSEHEFTGSTQMFQYASVFERSYQTEYKYYSDGNSTVKYKHHTTNSAAYWRTRSAYRGSAKEFCGASNDSKSTVVGAARSSSGLCPIFTV